MPFHRVRGPIQIKFGALRSPDGRFLGVDARPAAMKTALSYSLRRLRTDYLDLYMTGLDPAVPIEETVGAMGEMVQQGYARHIGITNVDADTIRRAHAAHPITALQCEYSLMTRDIEAEILPVCRELGIGITAYGVLGRGLLAGSTGNGEGDWRAAVMPRFRGDNLRHNTTLADALARVARSEGMTAAQAAIAWVASQGQEIIPLVGARTAERLMEAMKAPLELSAKTLAMIDSAIPEGAVRGSSHMSAGD
ncbi:aldo/keto reductase [Halotalea alkalilenta]|uniref:Aldo/keto reductase n=1 Tax=Halotalea alkalilenta TaxID=376489 RepID=A0A172YDP1_9GAMM|nr:aldo/keto reductase [Halotalea alkalilenta]ANF57202.1 aldo/keto reductase [Halotalea alkalilenta]